MTMTKPTSEQVTFTAAGSGATLRNLVDKVREVVSVKDFGAVGDNVADDTVAIQAAIDHVASTGSGTVFFPSGIYRISQTLVLPIGGSLMLVGDGMVETTAGTRLRWVGGDNSSMIDMGRYNMVKNMMLYTTGTYSNMIGIDAKGIVPTKFPIGLILDNVHVKFLTTGFYFNYGWYIAVYDCIASYCSYGVRLGTESNNIGFFNCHINNNTLVGIYFEGTGSRCNVFDACSIERNGIGVDCQAGIPTTVAFRNCYFENNVTNEVILGGREMRIDNCFFNATTAGAKAIKIASCSGIAINNCFFTGQYALTDIYELPATSTGFVANGLVLGQETYLNASTSPKAKAIETYPWLVTASALDFQGSNVVYAVTDSIDASTSPFDWLLTVGRADINFKRIVSAYLLVETDIVTGGTFRVRLGRSGPAFDQLVDTTFTGTVAIGVHQLTLVSSLENTFSYPTRSWRYNNVAGTSGQYRIALVLSP